MEVYSQEPAAVNPLYALGIEPWVDRAACGGEGKLVNPPDADGAAWMIEKFCDHCPVTRECADLREDLHADGVWGGVWWKERHGKPEAMILGFEARARARARMPEFQERAHRAGIARPDELEREQWPIPLAAVDRRRGRRS